MTKVNKIFLPQNFLRRTLMIPYFLTYFFVTSDVFIFLNLKIPNCYRNVRQQKVLNHLSYIWKSVTLLNGWLAPVISNSRSLKGSPSSWNESLNSCFNSENTEIFITKKRLWTIYSRLSSWFSVASLWILIYDVMGLSSSVEHPIFLGVFRLLSCTMILPLTCVVIFHLIEGLVIKG